MIKRWIVLLALILTTGCGSRPNDLPASVVDNLRAKQVVSQPGKADATGLGFNQLDLNHNGVLSLKEFTAGEWAPNLYPKRTFYWADCNLNGSLSFNEFVHEVITQEAAATAAVEANDKDQDYELGYYELLNSPLFGLAGDWQAGEKDVVIQYFMPQRDYDKNGRISIEELALAMQAGLPQAR